MSNQEQFGERDYWQPPERFEESKKGDCEDFALWAWRQVLHMKYHARFALGSASRHGDGHARVAFEKDGKAYLLEPLSGPVGLTLPRLSVLRYKPKFSLSWDGAKVSYFGYADTKKKWTPTEIIVLGWEWLIFWIFFFLRMISAATRRLAKASG
jgi:hypothetical protein